MYLFLSYVYECLHYVCALLVYSSCGGQKEEAESLEPELETIVNCHVDAGNQIRSSARAASAPNSSRLSSPQWALFVVWFLIFIFNFIPEKFSLDKDLLCTTGWPSTLILFASGSLHPECWRYRCGPPCSAFCLKHCCAYTVIFTNPWMLLLEYCEAYCRIFFQKTYWGLKCLERHIAAPTCHFHGAV